MNSAPDPAWHRRADVAGLAASGPGAAWGIVAAFLLGCLLSLIVPPLKSVDEADHVRRAGFLAQGQVLPYVQRCNEESAACQAGRSMSGGMLDAGLRDYLLQNRPERRQHESVLDRQRGAAVQWRGLDVFEAAPAAARVFPAVHAPAAAGLWLGQRAGLNVDDSYRLARVFSLASGLLVLMAACWVYRPPVILLALLMLPAGLFLASSGSVHFLVMALAVLVLACFLRVVALRERAPPALAGLMTLAVVLVGGSQVQLVPMLLLMCCAAWLAKQRLWWGLTALASVCVLAWQVFAGLTVVDFRMMRAEGAGELALRYLQSPLQFLQVLFATLSDREWLKALLMSVIGQFGELKLAQTMYVALAAGVGAIWLCSLASWPQWRSQWQARVVLLLCALLCGTFVFVHELLVSLPFAPLAIEGVQGHQLLVPVALGLMAFAGWRPATGVLSGLRWLLLVVLAGACMLLSAQRMLTGYYLPQFPDKPLTAGLRQATAVEVAVPAPPASP
ncbi:MAG: DUF2142 domain-containing protein [Lautropia sp.]|nr:DUF2142 domain-containing protein [Lautropia sp.]